MATPNFPRLSSPADRAGEKFSRVLVPSEWDPAKVGVLPFPGFRGLESNEPKKGPATTQIAARQCAGRGLGMSLKSDVHVL